MKIGKSHHIFVLILYILISYHSEEVTKKPLPHPFAVLQQHGNLYDDPAVVHVIDHSRHHRHHAASGTSHVRNHGHN